MSIHDRDMELEEFLAIKYYRKSRRALLPYKHKNSEDFRYSYIKNLDMTNDILKKKGYKINKSQDCETHDNYCRYYLSKNDSLITKFLRWKVIFNDNEDRFALILNDELGELVLNDKIYHLKTNLKDLHFWGDTIIGYIWDGQKEGAKINIVKFNEIKMMSENDFYVDTIKSLEFRWVEIMDFVNPVFRRPYSRPSLISGNDFWIYNYNGIAVQNGIGIQEKYSELNIDYVYASAVVDNAPLYLYRSKNDKYYILYNNQHQQLLFDEINYLKTSYDSEFPDKEKITFYGKKGLFWYSVVIK